MRSETGDRRPFSLLPAGEAAPSCGGSVAAIPVVGAVPSAH